MEYLKVTSRIKWQVWTKIFSWTIL